jgi:glycosyltransferase involved in cell wall biosynthesis
VYPGLDPQRYERHTLLSSAEAEAFERSYPLPPGAWRLILPGRITRLKGHHDFLWLLAALQRRGYAVQGLVVGSVHPRKQAYAKELFAAVDALGLRGSVHFLGPRSDLPVLMAASHLVLSLSQQPESFGRTVLESLSLGTSVAGYAYGGVGELLNNLYPHGLLCHPLMISLV